ATVSESGFTTKTCPSGATPSGLDRVGAAAAVLATATTAMTQVTLGDTLDSTRRRTAVASAVPPPHASSLKRIGTVTRLSTGMPARSAGTKRQRSRTVASADASSAG